MSETVLPVSAMGENLLPRRYQEEIFLRAQEGNVIAALDTGSGKTFISILLMKWVAARYSNDKKLVVFLVPKVALVDQQADFIIKQTPLRVSRYAGHSAFDMSDRNGWRNVLANTDVVVCTAQIFLNIITHSHWSLDKVSLLVFDECHHARKNHSYNGIMREYFQVPPGQRPKIFGMTASPIWNPRDAADSLSTLERNMHAKVIAVRDHEDELSRHLPRPRELLVEYPPPNEEYPTYPTPRLRDRLRDLTFPLEWDIPWDKVYGRYEVCLQCLGPFGAELYLYWDMKQRILALMAQSEDFSINTLLSNYAGWDLDMLQAATSRTASKELLALEKVLNLYNTLFLDTETAFDVRDDWCTPQLLYLAEIISMNKTDTFQAIVFVEQRHVALALAKLLPRLDKLKNVVRCAELIGHGALNVAGTRFKGMGIANQQQIVKLFREGEYNLLIATSVAEEGLDFPACDLVVRFDPILNMVAYVQSRGRARHRTSTFVVMFQKGNADAINRYRTFADSEPHLKQFYQLQNTKANVGEEQLEDGEIEADPNEETARERYVVPRTGAVLAYHSALGLLNQLCGLIPRDKYTPPLMPTYVGDFECELTLPNALPLPPELLVYRGPLRATKREAKRAVAFMAVKKLHQLGVFDDYLMPSVGTHGQDEEDADGVPIPSVEDVPDTIPVSVKDPWSLGTHLWLHVVYLDNKPAAGLITGTLLPKVDLRWGGSEIRLGPGRKLILDAERHQRIALDTFSRTAVWWNIAGKKIDLPHSVYFVPLDKDHRPDWALMERCRHTGINDWCTVTDRFCGHTLVMNSKEYGRPILLTSIRRDLTPLSAPPPGSQEAQFSTFKGWFIHKLTRKNGPPVIPDDDILIEGIMLPRQNSGLYHMRHSGVYSHGESDGTAKSTKVVCPMSLCSWMPWPPEFWRAMRLMPRLLRRITDVYRARLLKRELGLPPIPDDILIEAITLPSTGTPWSNQRLETFGDEVLKLAVAVHLINRFPHRHEGQLDVLRRSTGNNKSLLARALQVGLEAYLIPEHVSVKAWRYVVPAEINPEQWDQRMVQREYARKSLPDCVEALLGASYLAGGMEWAMLTATALGIGLGGPTPWAVRYAGVKQKTPASHMFAGVQERMGYAFNRGELLVEAVTHPSFKTQGGSSYQRLEFLGDAVIDLVVMEYLIHKFPRMTSGQLSWARSKAVCAQSLALVAVKHLELHKLILSNSVDLSKHTSLYATIFEEATAQDMIDNGWKHDPPKAISDVFEAVCGAILVDSGYNVYKTNLLVEAILTDVLECLNPNMQRDPVTRLLIWAAKAGCTKIHFQKSSSEFNTRNDRVALLVHGKVAVGPWGATTLTMAKGLVAERALQLLPDASSDKSLAALCTCETEMKLDKKARITDLPADAENLSEDETPEGFARKAQEIAIELQVTPSDTDEDDSVADAQAVEELLIQEDHWMMEEERGMQ